MLITRLIIGISALFLVCTSLVAAAPGRQLESSLRDQVLPAVVQIALLVETNENGQVRSEFIPVGSGTVIRPDGVVLTSWHVVDMTNNRAQLDGWEAQAARDGSELLYELDPETFLVMTTQGVGEPRPAFRATIIAEDPELDLALLRITEDADGYPIDTTSLGLPFIPLGDSSQVRQGDVVHIFGYPDIGGGTLQYTSGVISGFGFQPEIDGAAWIMTDASVSGGDSGGAAVDATGHLIGVPTLAGSLDCRPGDTNHDGEISAEDLGCIPTGGSISELRPVNLALPLLEDADETGTPQGSPTASAAVSRGDITPSSPQFLATPVAAESLVATPSNPADGPRDVPIERGNAARTGEMPGSTLDGTIEKLWEFDAQLAITSPPSLADGVLYVGAGNNSTIGGAAFAIDAQTGEERWRRYLGAIFSTPTIADGKAYITTAQGSLVILDASDGAIIAERSVTDSGYSCYTGASPIVVGETVYASFGCYGPEDTGDTVSWAELTGVLIAFGGDTGLEQWRFRYEGFDQFIAPAYADGTLVVADSQGADYSAGSIYAVDAENGDELWRFEAQEAFASTPVLAEGKVYVASWDGTLFALDLTSGLEHWRFSLGNGLGPRPAYLDGSIYVGNWANDLFRIDAKTGIKVDRLGGQSTGSALVTSGQFLLLSTSCSYVSMIDRESGERYSVLVESGCAVLTAPIVSDGVVYVGTLNGKLIALGAQDRSVPIAEDLRVEVTGDAATMRAAPSSNAVVRAELPAGATALVTGPSEHREGRTWWPIEVTGLGSGWVEESAIIARVDAPLAPASPTSTPTPVSTATATEPATVDDKIIARNHTFEPAELSIPADTDVLLSLPNHDIAVHNFTIDALSIDVNLMPGMTNEVLIHAPAGSYEFYCDLPGHRQAGQMGTLHVLSRESSSALATSHLQTIFTAYEEALSVGHASP